MANQIVELTNQGNAVGVAELASEDFLKTIPRDRLIGLVNKVHSMGQISRPELILDLNEQRHYKVLVKQTGKPDRFLLLVLGAESQNKYFSSGIAPYTKPVPREKPLSSDNPHKSALDNSIQALVDRYLEGRKAIGISIAIVSDKKTSFFNYGETREGSSALPTKRTIYEIGSITKTMTGMLLAQALTDKKLSLDDDVRDHLPGKYPNLEFNGKPI